METALLNSEKRAKRRRFPIAGCDTIVPLLRDRVQGDVSSLDNRAITISGSFGWGEGGNITSARWHFIRHVKLS